jgi:hypothetical protein
VRPKENPARSGAKSKVGLNVARQQRREQCCSNRPVGSTGGLHELPGRRSYRPRSRQFGRTSAPRVPHFEHSIRGPNRGTGTSSGQGSALKIASWWHLGTSLRKRAHRVVRFLCDGTKLVGQRIARDETDLPTWVVWHAGVGSRAMNFFAHRVVIMIRLRKTGALTAPAFTGSPSGSGPLFSFGVAVASYGQSSARLGERKYCQPPVL